MRDSLVFYRSFYESVMELDAQQFKNVVTAILEYGLNGNEPELTGIEKGLFILMKPQIDANTKRYENGKRGGAKPKQNQSGTKAEPKWNQSRAKQEPNENQSGTKVEPNVNVNVNENVNDKDIGAKRGTRFVPPTNKEVTDYCEEKEITVNADKFIDFYSSKGWMVGKNKMKDWKAAVRNWARSELTTKPNNTKGNKFTNFDQRHYDSDDLERMLLTTRPQGK